MKVLFLDVDGVITYADGSGRLCEEKLERRQTKGDDEFGEEPQPTGWIGGTLERDDATTSDEDPDSDTDPETNDET